MAITLWIIVVLLVIEPCVGRLQLKHPDANAAKCSDQIAELQDTVSDQKEVLKQLSRQLQEQTLAIAGLLEERDQGRDVNSRQNDDITSNAALLKSLQTKVDYAETTHLAKSRKAVDSNNNVAFTATLDGDIDGLGSSDTIVFNKALLNFGNNYDPATGVFTAPLDGVYSFTFFIGTRDENEMYADLYVNDQEMVSATAEGVQYQHDIQGGNSAVVQLAIGDVVQVKHHRVGDHVESGNFGTVVTTFSGFLIFPMDTGTVSVIGR